MSILFRIFVVEIRNINQSAYDNQYQSEINNHRLVVGR